MQTPLTYGYSDTPTPLPQVPRKVAFGARGMVALWMLRIAFMPMAAFGLMIGAAFLLNFLWAVAGTNATGHVEGVVRHAGGKNKLSYEVQYRYEAAGQTFFGDESLDAADYEQLATGVEAGPASAVGRPVTVRHIGIGSWRYPRLEQYAGKWGLLGILLLFLGVGSLMVWRLLADAWIVPRRRRWLCRQGAAVTGSIEGKWSGRQRSYFVQYRFRDPATGQDIESETSTNNPAYTHARKGQAVTVLYDPANPAHSDVCEFSPHRIIGAGEYRATGLNEPSEQSA